MSVETIKKVIDISSKCIKDGKFSFVAVAESLGDLAGVGDIIRTVIGIFTPTPSPEPDPVLVQLDELGKSINLLAQKMDSKFVKLEAFLVQIHFSTSIKEPVSKLQMYLEDCLTDPAKEALQNFQNAYNARKPLDLAYSLVSQLKDEVTNPLKKAMSADPLRTKQTFTAWYDIIEGVLGHLLFLEAVASGLLMVNYLAYDLEQMKKKGNKILEMMDKWKEEYKTDSAYWPGVKSYLEEYLDEKSDKNNNEKTDEIGKTLETILTDHVFFVIFMSSKMNKNHKFAFNEFAEDQFIEIYDKGGCNAFIYRSKKLNTTEQGNGEKLKEELATSLIQSSNMMAVTDNIENVPKIYFEEKLHNVGLIALLPPQQYILMVNCQRKFEDTAFTKMFPSPAFSVSISMAAISMIFSRYDFELFAGFL